MARIFLLLLLFWAPLHLRCLVESFMALSQARGALSQSQYRRASEFYVKAIRWRAPFNIFSAQAQDELRELIHTEGKEDRVYALSELRRALFSSRSFYFPSGQQSAEVQAIDRELTELGARSENPVINVEPPRIAYGWQILVQVGFWGWISSFLLLIWRGFKAQGEVKVPSIVGYGIGAVLFYCLWLYALTVA